MADIGELLAELRQDRHLSQLELAKLMNVSPGTISNYETGRYSPNLQTVVWFANFYNVTTDYLLGRTDNNITIQALNQVFTDGESVGDLIELLLSLHGHNRELACELLHIIRVNDAINISNSYRKENK